MAMTVSDVTAGQNVLKPVAPAKPKASAPAKPKASAPPKPRASAPPKPAAPAAPKYSDPLMQLVHDKGWAYVNAMGLNPNAPSTSSGSITTKSVDGVGPIPSSAIDPSGTSTMGGGLSTADTPEGDAFRAGLGQQADNVLIPSAQDSPQYQQQLAELASALAGFKANQQLAQTQYDDQLAANLRRMGWNAANNSWDPRGQGNYGRDFQNNEGDFAARGAFYSGPHLTAVDNLNQVYTDQKTDMDQARARFIASQQMAAAQAEQQNTLARQRALADAVARIAAAQGVDFNAVPGSEQLRTS